MFKTAITLLAGFTLFASAQETNTEEFTPPELKSMPSLSLPDSLARKGVEGTITATLLIAESGAVESVEIHRPLHPSLDSLVQIEALKGSFTPGEVNSEPVASEITFEFPFTLRNRLSSITADTTCIGTVNRRGAREILSDVPIAIEFLSSDNLPVPLDIYLDHLGSFSGQKREENFIVTTSNDSGEFAFQGIPDGPIELRILQQGYLPLEINDTILKGKTVELNCYLRPRLQDDYEVITYYSDEPEQVNRRQLNRKEASSVPGTGGDPLRAIHSLPGVARPAYGTGDIVIRGARPEDSRYYVDDMELPRIFHDIEVRSVLHPEALAGLDFYPGAYGTQFGNVTGGVVIAESREATKDRFSGSVDINAMDAGAYLEMPLTEKLSIAGSYRRFDPFGFVGWYVDQAMSENTIAPTYYDYMGRVDLKDIGKSSFSIQLLGSKDSVDITQSGADKESSFFNRIQTRWKLSITDKIDHELAYGYLFERNSYTSDWTYEDSIGLFSSFENVNNKSNAHFFNQKIVTSLSDNFVLKGGVSANIRGLKREQEYDFYYKGQIWEEISKDSVAPIAGTDTTITSQFTRKDTNYDYGTVSPWVQMIWQVSEPLLLVGGIRYDYYKELIHSGSILPEFGEYQFPNNSGVSGDPSLRLAARYQLNDKHTIKAALGNYNQTPEPRIQSIDGKWGTPTLPTTKASHYTAGYEWQISDNLSLDVQGYYNNRWDIPQYSYSEDTDVDYDPYKPDTKGRSYGLEFFLRHLRSEHFAGWLSYTLSRSEESDSADVYEKMDYDQTHNLMVLGSWYLPKQWEFGAKLQLTSGALYTPLLGVDPSDRSPIYGKENSERTSPACKLDLRVAKQLLSKRVTTSIYADVQNVLYPLYKTPEEKAYNYETGELEEYYMAPVPMLGVLVQF